jgi:A/G-specific adenine glycosylase
MNTPTFQKLIWEYYKTKRRPFPWRETRDPYAILVSEVMLQQTQTERVVPKYENFLEKFPDFQSLAQAKTEAVLREWQGLGYNRRALNLKRAAEIIAGDLGGTFPQTLEGLQALPGIGPYTAGALLAFSSGKRAVFIETNIRTVYLHFFFEDKKHVEDKDILKKIEETLPGNKFRDWYYALMDYGMMLKKSGIHNNTQSKHYSKQSRFKGSHRETRSRMLRFILENQPISEKNLFKKLALNDGSMKRALHELQNEGFIKKDLKRLIIS